MQLVVSNPAWAQQASSALAAATGERVELQKAAVEAEDCIVRYQCISFLLFVQSLFCSSSFSVSPVVPDSFYRSVRVLLFVVYGLLTNTTWHNTMVLVMGRVDPATQREYMQEAIP